MGRAHLKGRGVRPSSKQVERLGGHCSLQTSEEVAASPAFEERGGGVPAPAFSASLPAPARPAKCEDFQALCMLRKLCSLRMLWGGAWGRRGGRAGEAEAQLLYDLPPKMFTPAAQHDFGLSDVD